LSDLWLGRGGRHRSDIIIALPLNLLLCAGLPRWGLELGRHGGVGIVGGGSVVGSGVGVGGGGGGVGVGVVVFALFVVGEKNGGGGRRQRVRGRAQAKKINNSKRRNLPSPASLHRAPLYSASRSNIAEKSLKSAKILHRAMAEMILTHCVDVVEGEVFDVYESGLN
jgi:hypothetical protein